MKDSKSCCNCETPHKSWVADHIAALPRSGIRDFFELVNTMDSVISLGIGEPDFVTPWHIREAAIYALNQGFTHYTSNLGDIRLRRAICDYVEQRFGGKYCAETECLVTVGVSEALDILLRAILRPGDEVLIHEPSYVSYAPSIRMAFAEPVPVVTTDETAFVVQDEALEAKLSSKTRAILLNYPNNPTGACLTLEDKQRLAAFAIKHDLFVISDEIYSELCYEPMVPSIASLPGMKERTVLLNGMSKSFAMTGFRLGYACGTQEIIEAMMKIHQYSMLCAPSFSQAAGLEALLHGAQEREAMRQEYEERRNVIVRRLNEMGLTTFMPRGSFYVFPCIRKTGLTSLEFSKQLLEEKRVAVIPGTAFGDSGEGFVRCCYATSMAEIDTALDRMEEFVKAHSN